MAKYGQALYGTRLYGSIEPVGIPHVFLSGAPYRAKSYGRAEGSIQADFVAMASRLEPILSSQATELQPVFSSQASRLERSFTADKARIEVS